MKTLKTKYLVLILLLFATHLTCQARWHKGFINLDFQQDKEGAPISWYQNPCYEGHPPQYHFGVDPNGHNGAKAIWIANDSVNDTFGAASLNIMAGYEGKEIKFSGYVKTENVEDGSFGLWMRLDPFQGFDNMSDRFLKGDNDWTYCEITLPYRAESVKLIVVGGLMNGKGKMWFSDLKLTIDGKDIRDLKRQSIWVEDMVSWPVTLFWLSLFLLLCLIVVFVLFLINRKKRKALELQMLQRLEIRENNVEKREQELERKTSFEEKMATFENSEIYKSIKAQVASVNCSTGKLSASAKPLLKERDCVALVKEVNKDFDDFTLRLSRDYASLSAKDIRFICLVLMDLNVVEIATLLGQTYSGPSKRSASLKRAFGLDEAQLKPFLMDYLKKN